MELFEALYLHTPVPREVEMWDPLLDSWTSLAPLQERRGKLALVAAASGHIYAVAGVSGFRQTDNLDTIERCGVLSTCVNCVSII